jgi:hypothetical protein
MPRLLERVADEPFQQRRRLGARQGDEDTAASQRVRSHQVKPASAA